MTYQLNKWRQPGSRAPRIYINHPDLNAKVWFERVGEHGYTVMHKGDMRDFPMEFRCRESCQDQGVPSPAKMADAIAEEVLDELGLSSKEPWSAILREAEW